MKTKKLLMLSLATASLLTVSGCSNCKFCNWVTSYYKKTCSMCEKAFSACKCSSSKKTGVEIAHGHASIQAIESYDAFQAQVLQSNKPVVVKLQAEWCGACKEMESTFVKLATQMPNIIFATLDIDHVSEIAQKYEITGVPTFLFFKDGQEIRSENRVIGVVEEETFRNILEESLIR